ncbi:hypothetical protein GCM10009759_48640 [Kitasatospora saccharophila]|uniref:Uncharacterized protein n=1 Tax=Kitasatospora saccharophila TaxID=407973 RepID=A0ABN2XCP5_9ACTN
MDRCTWETRQMLQRILAEWFTLAPVLPDLEQHLAESTGYPVQVQPRQLATSAARIAGFLAEEHGQPSAAIGHLHDWLVGFAGASLRGDWVAFLAQVQSAPGLTVNERADLVVIAGVLCFPPVTPERTDGRRLVETARHAMVIGSPAHLLRDLRGRQEHQLARIAEEAVEKSRSRPPRPPTVQQPLPPEQPPPPPPPQPGGRRRVLLAVGAALLATAGLVTAVAWPDDPPPLLDQETGWTLRTVQPGGTTTARINVPEGAKRLETKLLLSDPNPGSGACADVTAELSTDQGGSSGRQHPGALLSVPVPSGRTDLRLTLLLHAGGGCAQNVEIQRVRFTR